MKNNEKVQTQHQKEPSASESKPLSDTELAERLLEANRQCIDRTIPLVRMLGRCRQQFVLYAESHRSKSTEEGDQKAATNEGLAKEIDEVLKDFRARDHQEDLTETTGQVGAD